MNNHLKFIQDNDFENFKNNFPKRFNAHILEMIMKYNRMNFLEVYTKNFTQIFKFGCLRGNLEVIKFAVEKGCNIHIYKDKYALHNTIRPNHVQIVKYLLDNFEYDQKSINKCYEKSWRYKELLEYLDDKFIINLSQTTFGEMFKRSCLFATEGSVALYLINHKNIKIEDIKRGFLNAVHTKKFEMSEYILTKFQIDLNLIKDGIIELCQNFMYSGEMEAFNYLISKSEDSIVFIESKKEELFIGLCKRGSKKIIEYLLNNFELSKEVIEEGIVQSSHWGLISISLLLFDFLIDKFN